MCYAVSNETKCGSICVCVCACVQVYTRVLVTRVVKGIPYADIHCRVFYCFATFFFLSSNNNNNNSVGGSDTSRRKVWSDKVSRVDVFVCARHASHALIHSLSYHSTIFYYIIYCFRQPPYFVCSFFSLFFVLLYILIPHLRFSQKRWVVWGSLVNGERNNFIKYVCIWCKYSVQKILKRSVYGIKHIIRCGGLLIVLNSMQSVLDFLRAIFFSVSDNC